MSLKHKKVYLSVSYNTSATVIRQVKQLIEAQGAEVLMYTKGTVYSTHKILESDFVFSIPPDEETPSCDIQTEKNVQYIISVGRGQYNEAEFACENDIPFYMLLRGINQFSKFHSTFTNLPDNWKKDYGNIIVRGRYSLESLLSNISKNKKLLLLN